MSYFARVAELILPGSAVLVEDAYLSLMRKARWDYIQGRVFLPCAFCGFFDHDDVPLAHICECSCHPCNA